MSDVDEHMKIAAQLARSGQTERAYTLFTRIVQTNPERVHAWLWLSEFATDLEEQTDALEQAIKYIPEGPDGQKDLQSQFNEMHGFIVLAASETSTPNFVPVVHAPTPAKKLNEDELYQQAERLTIIGRRSEALGILKELTGAGASSERVWLLLSELSPNLAEKVSALEKAVARNADNIAAARRLEKFQSIMDQPLQAGQYLEEWGEPDQARELYQALAQQTGSPGQQVEAQRLLTQIEKQQASTPPQKPTNPILKFARTLFSRGS